MSREGWYGFHYPKEWEVEEHDQFVAIYNPDGVGALHISAYQTPGPVNPRQELMDWFADKEPSINEEDVAVTVIGSKNIATLEQVVDHSFQKTWFISDNSYFFLVTYDCDYEDKNLELFEVEQIVKSLEIEPKFSRN